jgi:uncharacterized OB-fold protein
MSAVSLTPDLSTLEIPTDAWTQPFWDATAQQRLLLPRCADCTRFRWPPGPFCPHCRSQRTEWVEPGDARIYSFTIIPQQHEHGDGPAQHRVPALIEFPAADGIRILAAIVETPLTEIRVGAAVKLGWSLAANAAVPVFSIARLRAETTRQEP